MSRSASSPRVKLQREPLSRDQTGSELQSAAEAVLATAAVISVWDNLSSSRFGSYLRSRLVPKQDLTIDGVAYKLDLRAVSIRGQDVQKAKDRPADTRVHGSTDAVA